MTSTMAALRARSMTAVAVGTAAALVAVGPVVAMASETPEATPEAVSATPEAVSETPEATPEPTDEPLEPVGPPQKNEFSLGQSLQMRVGPDAKPNSNLANFRWSVNQLTVQGQEDGVQEVPVPDRGSMIRSLLDFSNPEQVDGIALLTPDVSDGSGVARTVSLFPQDEEPPITLEASFTLDGEPIDAWDVVGKSGALTATYKLSNLSTQEIDVTVENLTGDEVTKTVEADVPMVGIGKMLIPQAYTGLKLKGGTFGADGRGNNQVQFIALPFRPLSRDGSSTFGWAANVENATLPSMVLQVAPVYIPEDDPETPEDESAGGGGGLGLPAPNLDPAVAEIQAGVAQLVEGLDGFANAGGGPDPLDVVEDRLNNFFSEFGANIQNVATLVDPNNPDSAVAALVSVQAAIADVQAVLVTIEENDILAKIDRAAGVFTPDNAALLASLADPLQRIVDQGGLIAGAVNTYCAIPERVRPPLPDPIGRPLTNAECDQARRAGEVIQSPQFSNAVAFLNQVQDQLVPASEALQVINRQLPGVVTTLTPLLNRLTPLLDSLNGALVSLSEQLTIIGGGLEQANIDLPSLDAVVSSVVDQILNSPPGQNVTGGLGQVSAGLGDAKSILVDYLTEVIVTLQGVGETVGNVAGDVDAAVVTVKAEIGGLLQAAHTSPLPYGGDPADAPEGTVLAGAFEFRVDAADNNQPTTGTRILIGLIAMIGAGALSYFVGRRIGDADATTAEAPESALVGAAVGSAAAGAASGSVEADAPGYVVPDVDDQLTAEVPGVDAPEADLPEADLPEADVPEPDVPEPDVSEADASGVETPVGEVPDVSDADADGADGDVGDVTDPDGDGRPGS